MGALKQLTDNERLILDIVRRNEPIVRSAIPKQSPFTQPGVHRILESLLDRRLIVLGEAQAKGPGKPSPEIHIDRSRYFSLGIEVNTDAIDLCLVNIAGEPVSQARIIDHSADRTAALREIKTHVLQMLKDQKRTEADLLGVCLGISGFFVDGQLNAPEPLRDWSLVDLRASLAAHFNGPVWVANNATTAAIGESLVGIGISSENFAYLSFNYGFGGGVIIDGRPYFGANGNALEISALYDEQEHPDRPALSYLIAELNANNVDVQTIEDLRRNFDPTWPGVEDWIVRTLPQLNRALRCLVATFDPEYIVFGGEIPKELAMTFIERASVRGMKQDRYNVSMPVPKLIYTQAAQVGALGGAVPALKETIYI